MLVKMRYEGLYNFNEVFNTELYFHFRINGHESCASLLLGAIDPSIVSCRDDKGR
jgi:hypothetical protein